MFVSHRHHKRTGGAQRKARPGPTPRPGGNTVHVLYYMDNEQIPFTRKIPDRDITLGEFKEQIFARKGNYRWGVVHSWGCALVWVGPLLPIQHTARISDRAGQSLATPYNHNWISRYLWTGPSESVPEWVLTFAYSSAYFTCMCVLIYTFLYPPTTDSSHMTGFSSWTGVKRLV